MCPVLTLSSLLVLPLQPSLLHRRSLCPGPPLYPFQVSSAPARSSNVLPSHSSVALLLPPSPLSSCFSLLPTPRFLFPSLLPPPRNPPPSFSLTSQVRIVSGTGPPQSGAQGSGKAAQRLVPCGVAHVSDLWTRTRTETPKPLVSGDCGRTGLIWSCHPWSARGKCKLASLRLLSYITVNSG